MSHVWSSSSYGDTEYMSKRINGILEEKNYRDNGYLK